MDGARSANDVRVRLELASAPESVGLVRAVIAAVTQEAGLDSALVDDIRTAVSEACNNVVLHAYPEAPGPLIFSLAVNGASIEAVIRDQGVGIRPGPARNRGLGMGVALINSLVDRAEFQSSEMGTEVRMRFRRPAAVPEALGRLRLGAWELTDSESSDALRARSN